jgi:hypothetical protein
MTATESSTEQTRDQFLAELTDVAFEVAAHHGVRGSSVDHEVDLWKALGDVVRKQPPEFRRGRAEKENFVGQLTEAAYRVALDHGFRDPFVDVELDLWDALCRVVRKNASPLAGWHRC